MDTVGQDLHIDGLRWRSREGELHYELVVLPVSIRYYIGRNPNPIFQHPGNLLGGLYERRMPLTPHSSDDWELDWEQLRLVNNCRFIDFAGQVQPTFRRSPMLHLGIVRPDERGHCQLIEANT